MQNRRGPEFRKEVVSAWLAKLVPEIIERGGNATDLLSLTEALVLGTLYVAKETFQVDPQRAFELMKKQIDQRLADMAGADKKEVTRIIHG